MASSSGCFFKWSASFRSSRTSTCNSSEVGFFSPISRSMARRHRFGYGPLVWKGAPLCYRRDSKAPRDVLDRQRRYEAIKPEPCGTTTQRLVQFPAMANLASVLQQLEQERARLSSQLGRLNNALSALNGTGNVRTAEECQSQVVLGSLPLNALAGQSSNDGRSSLSLRTNARCHQPRVEGSRLRRGRDGQSGRRPRRRLSYCISEPEDYSSAPGTPTTEGSTLP